MSMIETIFQKALDEPILKKEALAEKFKIFVAMDWLTSFSDELVISPSDYQGESLHVLMERYFLHRKFPKSDNVGLWQCFIQQSAISGYPFLGLSFLIVADRLFHQVKKESEFYVLEERLQGKSVPYRNFIENLLKLKPDTIGNFVLLRELLPITDPGTSSFLQKFSENFKSALATLPMPQASSPSHEHPRSSTNGIEHSIEAKKPPEPVVAESEKGLQPQKMPLGGLLHPLKNHPIFGSFLPPLSLLELAGVAMENKTNEILKLLGESAGFTSWRDRFAKNIVLFYWALQNNKEKEMIWSAKSLWDTVFSLGARAKQEINLDTPQDMILALWEPHLYCVLVHLTLQAFDKLGESKFKINLGSYPIANVVEKLRSHPFILGIFISA